jgi:nucleoside-diphosphate-sugar epimerase
MAYAPTGIMPWTEDQPYRDDPDTTYGGFKAHAERVILDRHVRTNFPGSIARPAAIYGPDNNIHDMETAMFLRLRKGLPVLVPHEGLVTTSYGHVDDLVTNLVEISKLPKAAGEVFNITGQGCSAIEYVHQLADIVGVTPEIINVPTGYTTEGPLFGHLFKDRHHGILSVEKAADFGLTVERGFRLGHEQTYDWFCASPVADSPDVLADPMWGAGYDFGLEAKYAEELRA